MTDKEFKRLSRAQLIEVIYQLQLKEEELLAENQRLKEELADRRIQMQQAGNIAEAALAINNVMRAAQNAADQYLEEIRQMHRETEAACQRALEEAHREAATMAAPAKDTESVYESEFNAILEEFGKAQ